MNYINDQEYKEYSVNAALNFYDNRLQFKTNLGYAEHANSSEQNNNFVGDLNMEYRFGKERNWRIRAFYFNDRTGNDASKPQQGGGVGISYQQEFNTRKDLYNSSSSKKKSKKNNKK